MKCCQQDIKTWNLNELRVLLLKKNFAWKEVYANKPKFDSMNHFKLIVEVSHKKGAKAHGINMMIKNVKNNSIEDLICDITAKINLLIMHRKETKRKKGD